MLKAVVSSFVPAANRPKFRFTLGNLKDLLVKAGAKWSEDNVSRLSAAFSFYAILSLSPLLIFAVTLGGFFLASAQQDLLYEAQGFVGQKGAAFLHTLIQHTNSAGAGVVATITSILVAFFGASNLFLQLDMTMNAIWKIQSRQSLLHSIVKTRVLAFLGVLAFGALVVGWLLLDWWLSWLSHHTAGRMSWPIVSFAGSCLVLTVGFGFSFRSLPANKLQWEDVWPAAILTTIGFELSKSILNLYFLYAGVSAAYGVAGALVLILLWIYYTSQIYFFGAEFAYVWAHEYGSLAEA